MRRTELLTGVNQVQEAFEASNLIDMLGELITRPDGDSSALISSMLQSLNTYSMHARDYNAAALRITEIFGLNDLEDPSQWSQLVLGASSMSEKQRTYVQTLQSRALIVKHYLPKIASLFEGEAAPSSHHLEMEYGTRQVLTVIVIEEAQQFSSPERLTKVLQSIDKLYKVCATLEDADSDSLSVVACDSGEDKSFDFVGSAPAISRLKRMMLDVWNRVVFHRNEQMSKRLELVSYDLPILTDINTAEDEGTIGPEQAELLRRSVLDGTTRFLESGAIIPEIEEHTQHDPRRLMRPATRMLVSPSRPTETAASPDADVEESSEFLNDADRAELLRLFRRAGRDKSDVPAASEEEEGENGMEESFTSPRDEGEDEQTIAETAQELSEDVQEENGEEIEEGEDVEDVEKEEAG